MSYGLENVHKVLLCNAVLLDDQAGTRVIQQDLVYFKCNSVIVVFYGSLEFSILLFFLMYLISGIRFQVLGGMVAQR